MKTAKIVALLGVLIMGGTLIYGFTAGDFAGEGAQLLRMPWGIVSLIDVYVMFILFSCWIIYREKSIVRSAIWMVFVMVLGSFICSLYAPVALLTSGGDWRRLWMVRRWEGQPT